MKVKDYHGKSVIDSREVAEMVEKNHKDLLRDIRGYIKIMEKFTERNFAPSDFFIPSTYKERREMGRREKPVTFKIVVPPSAARVEQMGRFLVEAALKKEGLTAKITPVKRGPGDPILTIVPPETAGKSASA